VITTSIVFPVFNGGLYIASALSSLLAQEGDFEIVVSDDASTDDTLNIVGSFNDSRIKVMTNTERGGVYANLNRAISESKGEYLQIFSHDDIAHPGFVASQLRSFEHHEIGLVYSSCRNIDEAGHVTGICDDDGTPSVIDFATYLKISAKHGALAPSISSVMVRRAVIDRVGPFDPSLEVAGDLEFYNRVAEKFALARNRTVRLDVRAHSGSVTQNRTSPVKYMREEARILPYYRRHLGEEGYAQMMIYRRCYGRGRDHGRYLLKLATRGKWRTFWDGYTALAQIHRPESCMWNAAKGLVFSSFQLDGVMATRDRPKAFS
jgi:glycosyltransferase involved in cell wall biosynthesis